MTVPQPRTTMTGVAIFLEEVRALSRTETVRKLVRFTLVSVVSTTLSIAIIAVLYGLRILNDEVLATLTGNVIAIIPSYGLNRRWTWGKTSTSQLRREVVPFWIVSLLSIAFSMLGAELARNLVDSHAWSHAFDTAVVIGANLACFVIAWAVKLVTFNHLFSARFEVPRTSYESVASELLDHNVDPDSNANPGS